jgi:hypothetical protein
MTALDTVLDALTAKGSDPKPYQTGFMAKCPSHADGRPSLSIRDAPDGKVLLNCFAGCDNTKIVADLGLTLANLFPDRPEPKSSKSKIVATYDYFKADGSLSYQVVRSDPKDFRQRRSDGHGAWVWNLKDLASEDRELLFMLPKLHEFIAENPKLPLFIAEGEKDCLALWEQGTPATCNAGGAGKWRDGHSQAVIELGFPDVVVIADRDEPGKAHALAVRDSLLKKGYKGVLRTRIVTCEDGCKDPAALIDHHDNWKEQLADLTAPGVADVVAKLSPSIAYEWGTSVDCVKPDWLWREWLCKGALHVLAGKQSGGKSTWVAYVIAQLLQGKLDAPSGLRAGVISLEEPNDRLAARLRASGADMGRVALYLAVTDQDKSGKPVERPWRLPQDLDVLETFIVSADLSLIVVDGAGYAINGNQDYANIGTSLSGLAKVAERTGCAILAITHTRKEGNTDAVTAAIGSTAWTAIPRICWVCGVDPDDESESRRIVAVGKTNYRRPESAIAYTIAGDEELEVGYATNVTEVATTADQVVAPRESVEDRSELAEARRFILDTLSDGPMLSGELAKLAKKEGISDRTLRRAKSVLKVHSEQRREGGYLIGWEVSLPELGQVGPLAHLGVKTGQNPSSALVCQHGQTDNALGHLGPVDVSRENTLKTESHGQHGQPPNTPTKDEPPTKSKVRECSNCCRELLRPDSKPVGLCAICDPKREETDPLCKRCERYLTTAELRAAGVCSHHSEVKL